MNYKTCNTCGEMVPEQVAACPRCGNTVFTAAPMVQQPGFNGGAQYVGGRPTQSFSPAPAPQPKDNKSTIIIVLLVLLVVLLLGGGIFFWLNSKSDKAPAEAPAQTAVKHDTVVVNNIIERPVAAESQPVAKPTQVVVTGTSVRLRLTPTIPANPNANTLTYTNGQNVHPNKGDVLEYLGEEGDFYKVVYRGYTCYISKKFGVLR